MPNPYLIIAAIGTLLVSFVAGGVLGWHEKSVRVPALLEAQQTIDQKACEQVQLVTKGANDALQKNNDVIRARLRALRVLHPATCVRVSGATDIQNGGGEHAGQNGNGVSSDWLRGYAAEAEHYRTEVMVCTDFLKAERALPQN